MSAIDLDLAILLPPVSIFLKDGMGMTLVTNILLTLLGWIPGSIHAVWVLSKKTEH